MSLSVSTALQRRPENLAPKRPILFSAKDKTARSSDDRKPHSYFDYEINARIANVHQGRFIVGGAPDLVLTTVLGSCVAACVYDPVLGIGGMNHFLLPGREQNDAAAGDVSGPALRDGSYAMELMINEIFKRGGKARNLLVKLFGGAKVVANLSDVGSFNAEFALKYVRSEGFELVSSDLMGFSARRVQFWPASGRARVYQIPQSNLVGLGKSDLMPAETKENASGTVELF
jgi:chemotaxis protein CheD